VKIHQVAGMSASRPSELDTNKPKRHKVPFRNNVSPQCFLSKIIALPTNAHRALRGKVDCCEAARRMGGAFHHAYAVAIYEHDHTRAKKALEPSLRSH